MTNALEAYLETVYRFTKQKKKATPLKVWLFRCLTAAYAAFKER